MVVLASFILIFTVIQLLVAITNLVFRQPLPKKFAGGHPLVSVLIPARNEENTISKLLEALIQQNYNNIEILVFDDQSTDDTAKIVSDFAARDNRIRLISSAGLPEGWLGKNYACFSLARQAAGKYFLFLDADVELFENYICQTISFAEKHRLGLLSVFPKQMMHTTGEYVSVPNMNYILLSLLPLILVRKTKRPSLSAANGQFMLFNAEKYRQTSPHKNLKQEMAEDIKTAQLFKKSHIKIACLAGTNHIRCRMYNGFLEAANGFSRNVAMYFGNSLLLAVLFWLITTFGFIAVLFAFQPVVFWAYIAAVLLMRIIISAVSEQNILKNLILLIPQQVSLGVIIYKAILKRRKNQFEWKGRNIS